MQYSEVTFATSCCHERYTYIQYMQKLLTYDDEILHIMYTSIEKYEKLS